MGDTATMWFLVRLAALTVLVTVGVLVAGVAEVVLAGIDRAVSPVGLRLPAMAPATLTPVVVVGGGLVGVVLGGPWAGRAGKALAHTETFLHELGHVLVAAACGARPTGVVLDHDASGHATASWRQRRGPLPRLQRAAVAWFGYPAPPTFAAAGAALLVVAGPRPVLWAVLGAAALVTVLARSAWTLVVTTGLGLVALASLSDRAAPQAAGVAVALLTAIVMHHTVTTWRRVVRRLPDGHDAFTVREQLGVPARLVQVLQAVWSLVAATWTVVLLAGSIG